MQHPFAALTGEYTTLLAAMAIDADRLSELQHRAAAILDIAKDHAREWDDVVARTGVPTLWGYASFERESGSDYRTSPAQGDRWDRVSINVPRGLGPYKSWGDSAVAAYRIDHLDLVGAANWTWARACYEGETFNGMGPRNHGKHTGYLWAGTNVYVGGKYVSDGKWDANVRDKQLGMVPLMVMMQRLDPTLVLADTLPAAAPSIVPAPAPPPLGLGGPVSVVDSYSSRLSPAYDATWIQTTLNALGAAPRLDVDGSYGRHTRRAVADFQARHKLVIDGIAGPQTIAEMQALA
jgi:lysozyme family protein